MPTSKSPTVLSAEQLEHFRRGGFVVLRGAFDRARAEEMQRAVWDELREDHGIDREDRSTWRVPPHSPRRAKECALNDSLFGDRFEGAIGDLLGRTDWERPRTWGGFLVTFPDAPEGSWDVRSDHWHWDGHPDADGLLIFTFYSDVRPGGGGTLLLEGSHRVVRRFYSTLSEEERALPHSKHRARLRHEHPYLESLNGLGDAPVADRVEAFMDRTTDVHGVPCRVVELTGEPGDAVFCNLGMLHSASRNAADVPRLMRTKFLFLD